MTDTAPDMELLAAVELDMGRVTAALNELTDESLDPADVVSWLPQTDDELDPVPD